MDRPFVEFIAVVTESEPGDIRLYRAAFTHPSCHTADNYQRLEFLGDAALNLTVSRMLFDDRPEMPEGMLSRERMYLVRTEVLSRISEKLGFGEHIILGRSEETDAGRGKESILADVFEAFIGALYIDKGFDYAYRWVLARQPLFIAARGGIRDYKSELQERTQRGSGLLPEYVLVGEEGAAHKKTFHVDVFVDGIRYSGAAGSSRKAAEQEAARKALESIGDG